jgi:kynureninase
MMSIAPASQLDAADPLGRFRSRFVAADDPSVVAYLDGNSLGRPLAVTGERLAGFVAGAWGRRLIRSWDEAWMAEPVTVGDRLAEIALGAAAGQVIVADSTTVLLYKLIRAAVAARPGRDELVIDRANFPTDRFIVDGVAAERGLTVRYLTPPPAAGVRPDDIAAVIGERTALVVLSHVAYRSGFLADMAAITTAAHEAGALVLWDLCHSAGALPVELDACDVDLAAGCTYKYLNGGPGSPAFGYVATRLQEELRQPIWGWMGAGDPFAMGPEYEPAKGMRKFISGTPPVLAMQPLKDMLELIAEAGLAAVRRKSVALTERAIALADERLAPLGAVLASPRDAAERGSHVTVDHPRFAEVTAAVWKRGVIPDFRPPDGIRIGLSPLSTSFTELDRGVEAIAEELTFLTT